MSHTVTSSASRLGNELSCIVQTALAVYRTVRVSLVSLPIVDWREGPVEHPVAYADRTQDYSVRRS